MAGRDGPLFANTQADEGAIVVVVTFATIVVTTVCTSIRCAIRYQKHRQLGLDDAMLIAANILAIVQSVIVARAVSYGLGRHIDTLSSASMARYYQYSYASELLALISMACAKMSVLHLQRRLMGPDLTSNYMKRTYLIIGGCILVWVLFSVFAIALQCGTTLPAHYTPSRCAGGALWYPVTTINALTDAALALSFFPVIIGLAMQKQTKIKVACLLSIRLIVCIAIIVQIVILARNLQAADQSRAMVYPVMLQQIVMNLSIFTAVVVVLRGFFSNLTAGRFGTEIHNTDYELSKVSGNRYKSSSGSKKPLSSIANISKSSKSGYGSHKRKVSLSTYDGSGRPVDNFRPDLIQKHTSVRHDPGVDWQDRRSDGSQDNIIRQTTTWEVSHESMIAGDEEEEQSMFTVGDGLNETRAMNFPR